jgi:dTDP-4-dehydrorhamnose 3,5-epimerase
MEFKHGLVDGVFVEPKRKIPDERGTILHCVTSDQLRNPFGEVYFKKLYKDVINGWHTHESLTLNYTCLIGMIKLVVCDLRQASPTAGHIQEIFIGEDNHCLVHIPPGIANGSKGLTEPFALMCNVASHAHDPSIKYSRIDPESDEIQYDWSRNNF